MKLKCPKCKSDNINEPDSPMIESEQINRYFECLDCGCSFIAIYLLKIVEEEAK